MERRNFIASAVVVFATMLLTDFLMHQMFMKGLFASTPNLWRSTVEAGQFFPFLLFGHILTASFFAAIFKYGYTGTGYLEGVRYGALIGTYNAGNYLTLYTVCAWDVGIVTLWTVYGIIQCIICGVVCSLMYKKN